GIDWTGQLTTAGGAADAEQRAGRRGSTVIPTPGPSCARPILRGRPAPPLDDREAPPALCPQPTAARPGSTVARPRSTGPRPGSAPNWYAAARPSAPVGSRG